VYFAEKVANTLAYYVTACYSLKHLSGGGGRGQGDNSFFDHQNVSQRLLHNLFGHCFRVMPGVNSIKKVYTCFLCRGVINWVVDNHLSALIQGVRKLTGDNPKLVWAKFSTIS
jgi:hypothetical protein